MDTITQSKKPKCWTPLEFDFANILLGERIPIDIMNCQNGKEIIPAGRKIVARDIRRMARQANFIEIDPSPIRNKIREILIRHGK